MPVVPIPIDPSDIATGAAEGAAQGGADATQEKATGIFSNLGRLQSDITKGAANAVPITAQFQKLLGFVPEGQLKNWIGLSDPVSFFKKVFRSVFGGKYTGQQYRLGEAYLFHLQGVDIHDRGQVPNDVVPTAQLIFTILFGVRITTMDDLDALDVSVDAYMNRPDKSDIPVNAIQRAVMLKQRFFPETEKDWDVSYFEKYPLVAPIPSIEFGKLYTGDLPGGGRAENGVIVIPDDILSGAAEKMGFSSVLVMVVLIGLIIGSIIYFVRKNPSMMKKIS